MEISKIDDQPCRGGSLVQPNALQRMTVVRLRHSQPATTNDGFPNYLQ